jgi:hypothetical protein
MELVSTDYKERKSDMELLMDNMRIPLGKKHTTEKTVDPPREELLVTMDMINEIITAGEPEKPGNEFNDAIQAKLREILGVDLAGYFKTEVTQRYKSKVIRIMFKATVLGIGIDEGGNTEEAWKGAISKGLVPSLQLLKEDISKLTALLPKVSYP